MVNPMSDVIVVVPGIMGSVLKRGNKTIWDLSLASLGSGLLTGGDNLRKNLALDFAGAPVKATGLIRDLHLFPGLWRIDGYTKIDRVLRKRFDIELGSNYFEFPYDWRLDNRESARDLKKKSGEWLNTWREQSKNADAKLIFLAHSMGGLVCRYFLENLNGWKDTRKLFTFGTPFRGSVKALDFISNGFHKRFGPLTLLDLTDLVRTLPSVYQLLPIYPCYDPGEGKLWRVNEIEIPKLNTDSVKEAMSFHKETKVAVDSHLNSTDYRKHAYRLYPIVGIEQLTLQSARLDGNHLKALTTYEGKDYGGDGTVPRVSATPIGMEVGSELYVPTPHSGIQNARGVHVQLSGNLSGVDLSKFKATATSPLSLCVDDVFQKGEPIELRIRSPEQYPIQLSVEDLDGTVLQSMTVDAETSDWQVAEIEPLITGSYRVSISGGAATHPATDVFVVV